MNGSYDFKDLKAIKLLYCTFVCSHPEYAQAWNPQYSVYTSRLEKLVLALRRRPLTLLHVTFVRTNKWHNTFIMRGSENYDKYCTEYNLDLRVAIIRTIGVNYFRQQEL